MRAVRWCSRCEHAFDLDEDSANDAEVACPFCGAPAADVKTWESVRPSHPEWPTRPVFGGAYPTRPDTAAAEDMQYECTGIRKDGSRFPYRVHSAAIEFEDGPGTFVFLIDLSDED